MIYQIGVLGAMCRLTGALSTCTSPPKHQSDIQGFSKVGCASVLKIAEQFLARSHNPLLRNPDLINSSLVSYITLLYNGKQKRLVLH